MASAWDLVTSLAMDRAWAWLVVAARVVGLAATAPAWGSNAVGWRIRLVLVAMITFAVAPAVESIAQKPSDHGEIGRILVVELCVGTALGVASALMIAGARQAGELVGSQAGLAPASLLDPEVGGDLNPLGHLYGMVAMATFLVLDGPVKLVGSIIESYRAVPAGAVTLSPETIDGVFARVQMSLSLALRAAAPAVVAMVLAGLALGLLGRAAPSLQTMSLVFPMRVAIGLFVLFLGLASVVGVFAAMWSF